MKTCALLVLLGSLIVGPSLEVHVGEHCVGALHAMALAQEPEPGNPGHQTPPAGYFCTTKGSATQKPCACHRVDTSPACEGEPSEDNARCRVACFKGSCHCDVQCAPGGATE